MNINKLRISIKGNFLTHCLIYLFVLLLVISCASKKDSIVIVYPSGPRCLDCHLRKELITLSILNNIYESLVGFDENMKIVPLLADYWERVDSLTWIFYLRNDVLFHNGKKFDVKDVIYSLYRPLHMPESEFKQLQNVLDTIFTENPDQVILKTKIPRTFVLYDLALIGIMPEGLDPNTQNPIGTGPYYLETITENKLTLQAFSEYWGKKPEIKKVSYLTIPDFENRFKMLAEGKADIISYVPIDAVSRCEKIGRVVASPGVATRYLEFNLRKFPFNKREFRQAVNIGIDRGKIANDVYRSYAVPANQYLNPGVFGYDPARSNFDYNPDSAKKLIMQLGDLPVIELEYANVKYYIGEVIAEQLKNIGLQVKIVPLSPDEFWAEVENRRSNCYLISVVPNSYEGIGDLTSDFHTLNSVRGLGVQNRVSYSNGRLDSLIESLPSIIDQKIVAQRMSEIQDILLTDLPTIPIVWEKQIYCLSNRIELVLRLDELILVKDIHIRR